VALHGRLPQPLKPVVLLASQVHVLDDVEVVAERQILVGDLDAEPRRVLWPANVDQLAVDTLFSISNPRNEAGR